MRKARVVHRGITEYRHGVEKKIEYGAVPCRKFNAHFHKMMHVLSKRNQTEFGRATLQFKFAEK
eukprot:SAG11_NODE_4794_length_1764_cov_1.622222_2_plen_64_part_00